MRTLKIFQAILPVTVLVMSHAAHAQGHKAYDRLGNSYDTGDLSVPPIPQAMGGGAFCNPCAAGIFSLAFLNGSGLELNTPEHLARQDVVKQVFRDFSALLVPADDPCTELPNTAPFVRVQFVPTGNVANVDWTQTLGFGSTLRNAFLFNDGCNLAPDIAEGIVDGEVWRTINGGQDSWFNFQVGMWKHSATFVTTAHGLIALNFSGVPTSMYAGETLPPPAGVADLYTVVAHEVMHMLGIETHIQSNGLGLNNTLYFSRYDLLVRKNGTPWVVDGTTCAGWDTNLNLTLDLTTGTCGEILIGGPTAAPGLPSFGNNITHFDGNCASLPFLMHPDNTGPGQNRIPLQEEVNVLCDLGYRTSQQHGSVGSSWDGSYAVRTECGTRLAGVDDVFADCTTKEFYSYKQGTPPIQIDNFLDNDEDMLTGGAPIGFDCMEVIHGGGSIAPLSTSSISYTPDPSFVGTAVLRYRPYNASLDRHGNFTLIFIEVWPPDACTDCNILNGGDLEGWRLPNRQASPHAQYAAGTGNSPDAIIWNDGNSSWWNGQACNDESVPCGQLQELPDSWNGHLNGNEHYVAMLHGGNPSFENGEAMVFELCRPLLPGLMYDVEFQASSGSCVNSIQFFGLEDRPCNPQQGSLNWTTATPCTNNATPYPMFSTTPAITGSDWVLHSVPITYNGPVAPWVSMAVHMPGGGNFQTRAIYVDDVKIRPRLTASSAITPSCTGQSNGSIDLTVLYYEDAYTVQWAHGPTSEDLTGLAPGTYTVTITDTELGCAPYTETFTITEASCDGPFRVSKTANVEVAYAGTPVAWTIEVCNTSAEDETFSVLDVLPQYFELDYTDPANPFDPAAPLTVGAGQCEIVVITGYFTEIGTHTNTVTVSHEDLTTPLTASDAVTVLAGCPMSVAGIGDCTPNSNISMCLLVHSRFDDVQVIDFQLIYPDFLGLPGNPAAGVQIPLSGLSPTEQFSGADIDGATSWISWEPYGPNYPWPMGAYGHNIATIHVEYTAPVDVAPPYRFFCMDFVLSGTPPVGQNAWHVYARSTSTGQLNRVDLDGIGSFLTQALTVTLNGCPDVTPLNALFNVDAPVCGGEVSVEAVLPDPDAVHTWTWGDDRTTPTNGAAQWTYDYFSTITENQGWPLNPVIGPAAPGTYTITHTVFKDGVSSSSSQPVFVAPPCCTADTYITDGKLSSSYGYSVSGTVSIEGQFFIDQAFTFDGATVKMEPGAEIIVNPGKDLFVDNSTLESCSGVMWKGITANDGCIVLLKNSVVADAEAAVTGKNSSILWSDGSELRNNRVALRVPDQGSFNSVAIYATNSEFHAAGPLAMPYPGQATVLGQRGYAGLEVFDMALDLTGGGNVFHDLSNGVVARRSDVKVSGCTMHDIQPDGAYAYNGNGSGIYAKGDLGFYSLDQGGHGIAGAASFEDCRWGIYTEYMTVRSEENRMVNVGTGYRVDRSGYREVDILNNSVDSKYTGIDLRFNEGNGHLLVQGNIIKFGSSSLATAEGHSAIRVEESGMANKSSAIIGNAIHYRQGATTAKTGIRLTAADDYTVADNNLWMTDNTVNETGIRLNGCKRNNVSCNNVYGASETYNLKGQSAIRNVMGSDPLISCNNVDKTTNGIIFSGAAYGTDLRGNNFHKHKYGLHLDGTAIIESQHHKGNLWHEAAPTGGWSAWYESPAQAAFNPCKYDPAVLAGGTTEPFSQSPLTWFTDEPGVNYQCEGEVSYCLQFTDDRCKDCLREIDDRIASEAIVNGNYTEETKWMFDAELYKKLNDHPELLAQDPLFAGFHAEMEGTLTAQFKQIDDGATVLYGIDEPLVAELQQNQVDLTALMVQLKEATSQLGDPELTTAQRAVLMGTVLGYQQAIRDLSTYNSTVLTTATNGRVLDADNLKATNTGLVTSALIEDNQKKVNEIHLSTVAKDVEGFTAQQADELLAIAEQCPMLGGNAVFRARALYSLIDDTREFDDEALCLAEGIIVKSLTQPRVSEVKVLPNPATDAAALVLTAPTEEVLTFVVYDALGAEVMRHRIAEGTLRLDFSTAYLAPAMYHYTVTSATGVGGGGKLSIVR